MSLRYAFLGLRQLILKDVGNRQVDIKDVPSAVRYIRWECHFGVAKKKKKKRGKNRNKVSQQQSFQTSI